MQVGYDGQLVTRNPLGVSNCILQLAAALVRDGAGDGAVARGESPLVLYTGDPEPWRAALAGCDGAAFRLSRMPAFTRFRALRNAWQQVALPRRAADDAIDVFHAAGYVMPLALRVPTVLTVFDLLALRNPELCRPVNRWHYRQLVPASVRRARHVIAPSRAVRDALCESLGLPEARVSVVPPGLHDRFHRACAPTDLERVRSAYRLRAPFALFVGNAEPKKNLARLIRGFGEAQRQGLAGELVIAGGAGWGPLAPELRGAANVRWLGYVPDDALPALYALASEFVFPSLAEGFGLPVVEAMASGTVVVASDIPAVAESDPEAVVCVDPLSVASIAEGLLKARGESPNGWRIARARAVAAGYTWTRAARATRDVYRQVRAG